MKTTYATCQPAGLLDFANDPDNLAAAIADGAHVEGTTARWCNAHIAVWGTKPCRKGDVVLDTEHPMYGTLATRAYPSDRWPLMVIGGSSTGSHLFVAPLDTNGIDPAFYHNGFPVFDHTFTREEAELRVQPERASRVNRRRDGSYSDYVHLGAARYRRDWSD